MLREPNYTSAECIEDNAEHSEDQTDVQNAECSAQDTGWRLIHMQNEDQRACVRIYHMCIQSKSVHGEY